jgi:hypothetical protein
MAIYIYIYGVINVYENLSGSEWPESGVMRSSVEFLANWPRTLLEVRFNHKW